MITAAWVNAENHFFVIFKLPYFPYFSLFSEDLRKSRKLRIHYLTNHMTLVKARNNLCIFLLLCFEVKVDNDNWTKMDMGMEEPHRHCERI